MDFAVHAFAVNLLTHQVCYHVNQIVGDVGSVVVLTLEDANTASQF